MWYLHVASGGVVWRWQSANQRTQPVRHPVDESDQLDLDLINLGLGGHLGIQHRQFHEVVEHGLDRCPGEVVRVRILVAAQNEACLSRLSTSP